MSLEKVEGGTEVPQRHLSTEFIMAGRTQLTGRPLHLGEVGVLTQSTWRGKHTQLASASGLPGAQVPSVQNTSSSICKKAYQEMRDTEKASKQNQNQNRTKGACSQARWYKSVIPATQEDVEEGLHGQGPSGCLCLKTRRQRRIWGDSSVVECLPSLSTTTNPNKPWTTWHLSSLQCDPAMATFGGRVR